MNVGIDEAGKGCIFGPIYSAAVIWDPNIDNEYLRDSKKLSKLRRAQMFEFVKEHAIDYSIACMSHNDIDNIGVHIANMNSMHKALDNLTLDFDRIHVDGNVFIPYKNIPHECIIGGDSKFKEIMAASILAKVSHDNHIEKLLCDNPELEKYGLNSNMGYGTEKHIGAVKMYGRHEFHRQSFRLPFEKKISIIDLD